MIEIFFILLSAFFFIIIFTFPVNYFKNRNVLLNSQLNFFDILSINVILHSNFLLIFSFFSVNLNLIFFLYIFLGLFFLSFNFKQYLNYFHKNKIILFLFLIVLYSLFFSIAQSSLLTWDGAAHWLFKANNFYQGGEFKNLNDLPFNYYPHLGTYVWAFFWKNSFLQIEYYGRFFFIFIFLISIFSLGQQLNNSFSKFEKIFIISSLGYLSTNFFLFGGYQEYLIFFLLFSFSRFLFLALSQKVGFNILITILLLLTSHLILWTKQEGFFYYIFLNLIFLIHAKSKLSYKIFYFIFCLFFFSIFLFVKIHFFESLKFNENLVHPALFDNLNLIVLLKKIILISKYVLISFVKYPIWILIIFSSLILFIKYKFFNKFSYLYTFAVLSFSFIYLIYIQMSNDLVWSLPLTLSRLIFQISGFFIFLIIEFLNRLKR